MEEEDGATCLGTGLDSAEDRGLPRIPCQDHRENLENFPKLASGVPSMGVGRKRLDGSFSGVGDAIMGPGKAEVGWDSPACAPSCPGLG